MFDIQATPDQPSLYQVGTKLVQTLYKVWYELGNMRTKTPPQTCKPSLAKLCPKSAMPNFIPNLGQTWYERGPNVGQTLAKLGWQKKIWTPQKTWAPDRLCRTWVELGSKLVRTWPPPNLGFNPSLVVTKFVPSLSHVCTNLVPNPTWVKRGAKFVQTWKVQRLGASENIPRYLGIYDNKWFMMFF